MPTPSVGDAARQDSKQPRSRVARYLPAVIKAPEGQARDTHIERASGSYLVQAELFWLRRICGLVSGRSLWGLEPLDLRLRCTAAEAVDREGEDVESADSRRRAHSTDGLKLAKGISLYSMPLRRHVWGEEQYSLHASWGELFLDLIFVGAAYRLGDLVKYSFCEDKSSAAYPSTGGGSYYPPSPAPPPAASDGGARQLAAKPSDAVCVGPAIGILYCIGLFQCCLRLWLADLHYRSRFESTSRCHRLLDLLGYFALVYAAANIKPVHEFVEDYNLLYAFVIACCVGQGLWILRWLEIATRSHDEER